MPNWNSPIQRRILRGMAVIAVLWGWYAASMRGHSSSSPIESHGFAGPFFLATESKAGAIFAAVIGVSILVPATYWIVTGRVWFLVLAATISGLSIGLTILAAYSASC